MSGLNLELEVFRNIFLSIADEMGIVLRRTAFSANIKERLDFSCAVYTHITSLSTATSCT